MSFCRHQLLQKIQSNEQWCLSNISTPTLLRTSSHQAIQPVFNFMLVDTTFRRSPFCVFRLCCTYINREQNGKLSSIAVLKSDSPTMKDFHWQWSFLKAQYNSWSAHNQWQIFVASYRVLLKWIIRKHGPVHFSMRQRLLHRFPHKYITPGEISPTWILTGSWWKGSPKQFHQEKIKTKKHVSSGHVFRL